MPWSPEEVETLRKMAPRPVSAKEAAATFPARSVKAIKKKLSEVRAESGCRAPHRPPPPAISRHTMLSPDTPYYADDEARNWRRRCERSNEQFLAALRRAGLAA